MSGKRLSNYKINILCSYHYVKDGEKNKLSITELSPLFNFILDSGGFTNYWQSIQMAAYGKRNREPVTLDSYIEFCKRIDKKIYGYIALDLPRNPQVTLDQLDAMVAAGLKPMPVFAEGVDYSVLPEYMALNNRLCVAGAVQSTHKYTIQRYQKVMKATNGKAKIHALGFGRWPLILSCPVTTCDSSTWINGSKFGYIKMFSPDLGLQSTRRHILANPKKTQSPIISRIMGMLRRCNVTIDDLNDDWQWKATSKSPSVPAATHAFAYTQFIYYIRRNFGVEYFLVLSHLGRSLHLAVLMACWLHMTPDMSTFDYQKFKKSYMNFLDIKEPKEWRRVTKKVMEKFYEKIAH